METKRNRNIYSLQLFLAAFLLLLVLEEPSSFHRAAAMQESSEDVGCSGSMVECSDQMAEEELSMESETSRRFVQAVKHISPPVLRADSAVCGKGRRGQPYQGSCLPPPSNNYHRGCLRRKTTPILIHHPIFKCLEQERTSSTNTRQRSIMEPESFPHFFFLLVILSLIILQLGDKVALKTNGCNGSIAECNEEYEFVMPSHVSERYLEETKKYISPGTLKPDQPVCNGGASGQSYSSSCLPPPSNPPSRGCSKYYRCRSDD
uniref:Protein RALF-like 32 n=1 Tax=Salix viminalis TaxID=40686 RepID=A0A6N2MRS7_SALVM